VACSQQLAADSLSRCLHLRQIIDEPSRNLHPQEECKTKEFIDMLVKE
jgi:hypothetical protein